MKNMKKSRNLPKQSKQRGMAILDQLTAIGAVIGGIALVLILGSEVTASGQEGRLQAQVGQIKSAALKWKGNANNFAGITMGELCKDNYIGEDLCGPSDDGKKSNAFGGDFVVAANTNPGLLDVTVDLPSDTDKVNMVARTMASATRNKCTSVTGCSTIAVTGNAIKSTF